MALEKDFELLDDYLSNRLSGEEKAAFEKKLEADPELKQELNVQQDFVEGIRKARIAELKSMLNNIPVAPAQGGQSMLIKAGSWVAITGLIITATYFYFLKDDSTELIQEAAPMEQPEVKTNPVPVEPTESET